MSVAAKYPGNCACCGERYPEYTEITYSAEYEGWILVTHVTNTILAPDICSVCFTEKSLAGTCNCDV